ncbi:TR10B factor, partial [Chunga burmeisteri]|nr:TR10B factor [Chunga burmeisteri]
NSSSKCLPCNKDEYIEYPNDFRKCLGCRTCREDQVELSPCQRIRDTQCVCRNGTFCSPDHPCEMCQKCRPRCAKNEVEQAPCTPHSDRRCGPPTGTFSGISDGLIVTIAAVVAVVLVVLVLGLWKCRRCRSPGGHWVWGTPGALTLAGGSSWVWAGWEEGLSWEKRDHSTTLLSVSVGVQGICWGAERGRACGMSFLGKILSDPAVRALPCSLSFSLPLPLVLRRSFDVFAQDVPCKDWKRYGRALDLMENDIALAEMNDRYSLEPFFQMLNTWQNREGMNASVNTLLETLHEINLGGIAEDIASKLVQQGSFQYGAS